MDIRRVIVRCALYKLRPQYKPSRIAIRAVVDELANVVPVIGYEVDETQRNEITESLYARLGLN